MTSIWLKAIRKIAQRHLDQAEDVLQGKDDYDGADGARYISELCAIIDELVDEVPTTTT